MRRAAFFAALALLAGACCETRAQQHVYHLQESGELLTPAPSGGIDYTPPVLDDRFQSKQASDAPRILTFVFDTAENFLELIQQKDPLPPGLLVVSEHQLFLSQSELPRLAGHYTGVLVVLAIGLVVVVVSLLVSLFCCCCCCCGGSRHRGKVLPDEEQESKHNGELPRDRYRDNRGRQRGSRSPVLAAVVGLLAVVILLGTVCTFMTNSYMGQGIQQLPSKARTWLGDIRLFLNNTKTESNSLLVTNYGELSHALDGVTADCQTRIQQEIRAIKEKLPFDLTTAMAKGLQDSFDDISNVPGQTQDLIAKSSSIYTEISSVSTNLDAILKGCGSSCPSGLDPLAQQLRKLPKSVVPDDFLSDVIDKIDIAKQYTGDGFVDKISQGEKAVNAKEEELNDTIKQFVRSISKSIQSVGRSLGDKNEEVATLIDNANDNIVKSSEYPLETAAEYIKDYDKYRYAGGLVVSVVLLIAVSTIGVGIFCGVCSTHPTYKFLMVGVCLVMATMSVLMLVTTELFVGGLLGQRLVCEPLRDPAGNQLFALLDQLVDLNALTNSSLPPLPTTAPLPKEGGAWNLSSLIRSCHQNHSLYEVLDLKSKIDIEQIRTFDDRFNYEDYEKQVDTVVSTIETINLLPDTLTTLLQSLKTSDLSKIDFDTFAEIFKQAFATLDQTTPSDWARQLQGMTIPNVDTTPLVDTLNGLQDKKAEVQAALQALQTTVTRVQESLKLGSTSLAGAVDTLSDRLDQAQAYIRSHAGVFKTVSSDTVSDFKTKVRSYLDRAASYIEQDAMKCGPFSLVYNSTLVATCDDIIAPLNGFWASAGLCLVLLIPTVLLARIMAART